jgi:hypothetical protein
MKWAGGRENEEGDGLTIPDCLVVVVSYEYWAVPRCCYVIWRWEYSLHILLIGSNSLEPCLCSKTSAILGGFESCASLFSNVRPGPAVHVLPILREPRGSAYLMISSLNFLLCDCSNAILIIIEVWSDISRMAYAFDSSSYLPLNLFDQ